MCTIAWPIQAWPSLHWKTRPRCRHVSLSLSMFWHVIVDGHLLNIFLSFLLSLVSEAVASPMLESMTAGSVFCCSILEEGISVEVTSTTKLELAESS